MTFNKGSRVVMVTDPVKVWEKLYPGRGLEIGEDQRGSMGLHFVLHSYHMSAGTGEKQRIWDTSPDCGYYFPEGCFIQEYTNDF